MKKFARCIGALPFLGRMKIRPYTYRFYQSESKEGRLFHYTRLKLLLIFFVILHACFVGLGIHALSFNAPILAKGIYVTYALINMSVVLVQVHLYLRARVFWSKDLYSRGNKSHPKWSSLEERAMWTVTLGGNLIFIICYFLYR